MNAAPGLDAFVQDGGAARTTRPAMPLPASQALDRHVRRDSLQQERAIARKFYELGQRQTWPYVAATILGFIGWVALFPLTIWHIVPLWAACVLSTLAIITGWLIAHEAMHDTLGRKGTRRRFWNELTGWLALFPLLFPFSIGRITHLQHHLHCNDPLRDPDQPDNAPSFGAAIVKVWLNRQPNPNAQFHHVRRVLLEQLGTPEAKAAYRDAVLVQLAGTAFFIGMALSGHALAVALVWWLPRWLALVQIRVGFSWEPHHPHTGTGRYTSTRVFRSRFGRFLSMGIEGHLAHHLYPNVPMHLTRPMLVELRPMLEARGVDYSAI